VCSIANEVYGGGGGGGGGEVQTLGMQQNKNRCHRHKLDEIMEERLWRRRRRRRSRICTWEKVFLFVQEMKPLLRRSLEGKQD